MTSSTQATYLRPDRFLSRTANTRQVFELHLATARISRWTASGNESPGPGDAPPATRDSRCLILHSAAAKPAADELSDLDWKAWVVEVQWLVRPDHKFKRQTVELTQLLSPELHYLCSNMTHELAACVIDINDRLADAISLFVEHNNLETIHHCCQPLLLASFGVALAYFLRKVSRVSGTNSATSIVRSVRQVVPAADMPFSERYIHTPHQHFTVEKRANVLWYIYLR
jgi:hypothetical protein